MQNFINCESFQKPNDIRIIVNILNGDSIELDVRSTDCIKDIKDRIENSSYDQLISYRGSTLQDQQIIDECGILNNSTINIINRLRGGMQIFAKTTDGKTIAIEVTKNETINDFKKKIQQKNGIAPEQQKLIFNGKVLEYDKKIGDYDIVETSIISVVTLTKGAIQILAQTLDGKTVALEVDKNDSILNVKAKIQLKTGLHPDEQKLVFNGGMLEDDKTVETYNIIEKSVIRVVARLRGGLREFVKIHDTKDFSIKVLRTETYLHFQSNIQGKQHLLPDEAKCINQDNMLKDIKIMDECKITDKFLINDVVTLRGGITKKTNIYNIFV